MQKGKTRYKQAQKRLLKKNCLQNLWQEMNNQNYDAPSGRGNLLSFSGQVHGMR